MDITVENAKKFTNANFDLSSPKSFEAASPALSYNSASSDDYENKKISSENAYENTKEASENDTDMYQNHLSTTYIRGIAIVSLLIDGKERLCLAQISNTLLKNFSYNEIHNRRVALGINCIQCTPVQLEILRRTGAMPVSSRRCGMITKREAERLVKSFLEDNKPPSLPESFTFSVQHKCGWGCKGTFYPSRYNSSRAKCIRCFYCDLFYSPNKFIFHAHQTPDAKYVQPDTANFNSWRRHLILLNPNRDDNIANAWEDVKAIFNGGTRKRMISYTDRNNRGCSSRSSSIDSEQVKGSEASFELDTSNKHLSSVSFQNSDVPKTSDENSKLFMTRDLIQNEKQVISHSIKRKESPTSSDEEIRTHKSKRKEKFTNYEKTSDERNIESKAKHYHEFIEHQQNTQSPNFFQQNSTNEVNLPEFLPNNFYINNFQAYSKLAAFTAASSINKPNNKMWTNKSVIDEKIFPIASSPLNNLSKLIPQNFSEAPIQPGTLAVASSLGGFYSQINNLIDYWKNDERFYLAQLEKLQRCQYPMSVPSAANSNNMLQMGLPKEFLMNRTLPVHQNRFSSAIQAAVNLQKMFDNPLRSENSNSSNSSFGTNLNSNSTDDHASSPLPGQKTTSPTSSSFN